MILFAGSRDGILSDLLDVEDLPFSSRSTAFKVAGIEYQSA